MITITDNLPECLEFAGDVTYINSLKIITKIDGKTLTWKFPDDNPSLSDGESMAIVFDTIVVECAPDRVYENHTKVCAYDRNSEPLEAESIVLITLV